MFELVMHPTSWDPPPARSSLGSACCIAGSLEHGPGPHFAAPGCRVLTLSVEWVPCGGGKSGAEKGGLGRAGMEASCRNVL